ncbi:MULTISPECIES: hypothetical protein [unclassified Flavobacterium]|jgi:hypothetical protein|uniref:hypothetical protein n=1 Tax=unclassified Flavobacterium TaxID=196869 RepID=UPI0025BF8E96|nr:MULTISPECIES: hypothetical protein [unclassified Flavobacterium]
MTLFIDKIEEFDLGGFTTDIKKAEYILAVHNLSFEKILSETPKTTELPSGMFPSGKYVVSFNISWDLKSINIGFMNYEMDLDKYFDLFADCMSPKGVAGFHIIREKIKLKNKTELNKIELSDDNSDFVIAYGNYIEHRNHQ